MVDEYADAEADASPAEIGQRSCSACLVAHAGMKLGRKLTWNAAAERFVRDDEANGMLGRTQRGQYGTDALASRALSSKAE